MSFNKMMDPGSVVRESEYAQTAEGGGLQQKLVSLYGRLASGESLTPALRANIVQAADQFYTGAERYYRNRLSQYQRIADENDLDKNLQSVLFPTWFSGGADVREPVMTDVPAPTPAPKSTPKKKGSGKTGTKRFYNKATGQPIKEGTSPAVIDSLRKKGLIEER